MKEDYRVDEVLRLYKEGTTVADIIETVDMSYDRVLRLLKKNGVYTSKKLGMEDTSKERIMELLDTEKKVMNVVNELRVPYLVVKSVEKEKNEADKKFEYRGIFFNTYNELKFFKQQTGVEVRLLALEGKTKQEIAKILGVSLKSIGRFLEAP